MNDEINDSHSEAQPTNQWAFIFDTLHTNKVPPAQFLESITFHYESKQPITVEITNIKKSCSKEEAVTRISNMIDIALENKDELRDIDFKVNIAQVAEISEIFTEKYLENL